MLTNFKEIEKFDVWPHLWAGKKVFAVILKSKKYVEGVKNLTKEWSVGEINDLINREVNVVFYEEIEKEEK